MRKLADLPDSDAATRLAAALVLEGTAVRMTAGTPEGATAVWVVEEDDVPAARETLAEFRADPEAPRFREAAARALAAEKSAAKKRAAEQKVSRHKHVDVRTEWRRPTWAKTPVTSVLIAGCLLVAVLTFVGDRNPALMSRLQISDSVPGPVAAAMKEQGRRVPADWPAVEVLREAPVWPLPEIRSGEVWRLVTPIFLHFGPAHLLFNMLALLEVGGLVEWRRGSLFMLGVCLLIAVISNLVQYRLGGPSFGGISGVISGLFGYAGVKTYVQPRLGIVLPGQTLAFVGVWLLLCMTPALTKHIANGAHVGGLLVGIVVALLGWLFAKATGRPTR